MGLCENRPEGFGPRSNFSSHLPTSCFTDVIVVPLATWIYLTVLILVFIARWLTTRSTTKSASLPNGKTTTSPGRSKHRSVLTKVLQGLYVFLILGLIALTCLEIARLSVAQLGIGLLPFTFVGAVIALALRLSVELRRVHRRFRTLDSPYGSRLVKGVNCLFWVLLLCVVSIKLAIEVIEEQANGRRMGTQAQYPIADEYTDDAAFVGVVFLLLLLEAFAF